MFNNILATLNELKGDISSCHTRISEMEPRREHNEDTDSQRETTRSVEQEDDSLSLLAGNVEGDPLVSDALQDPAIYSANEYGTFFLAAWNLFTWTNEKQVPFMTFLPVNLRAHVHTDIPGN